MSLTRRAVFRGAVGLTLGLVAWAVAREPGTERVAVADRPYWSDRGDETLPEFEPWPPLERLPEGPGRPMAALPEDRPVFHPQASDPVPEAPRELRADGQRLGTDLLGPAEATEGPLELGRPVPLTGEDEPWSLQVLPDGLIYRSYLAGVKEPRSAIVFNHEDRLGWLWDIALGGRVGLLRYGTEDALYPDGWQIDFEGAALLRLDPEEERDLYSTDYRFGFPLTYGDGPLRTKFGYYHLSSHMGDEFMLKNPGVLRDNYVRDALVLGKSLYLTTSLRFYAEVAWAFYDSGRARPWEVQFGMDYSPMRPGKLSGAPFVGLNGHLLQEFDYRGAFTVQAGWQWRGQSGQLFRIGMQYYRGKSDQWEFADQFEQKVGMGIWYDF